MGVRLHCPPNRAVVAAVIGTVVAADREGDAAEGFLTLQGGLDHFIDKLGFHPLQQPQQLTAR